MKTIRPDELYQNVSDFLKSKGVELKDGAYTERVRKSCGILTDAINTTQKTARRAKAEVDKTLDHLRQSIHQATAPTPPSGQATPEPPRPDEPAENRPAAAPSPKPTRPRRKPAAPRAKARRRK